MSLRFALWLTEQGIISCDQFCGLVKIQQDSLPHPGAIALQRNLMSIRQVAEINNRIAEEGTGDFLEQAVERRFIQPAVAELISRLQELSGESLTALAIRCGLVTNEQARVLFRHFLRSESRRIARDLADQSSRSGNIAAVDSTETGETIRRDGTEEPRQPVPGPKFRQRPVIVHQYDVTY